MRVTCAEYQSKGEMMELWMMIVMVMMAELGMHYFPWRMWLRGRKLPRLAAYTLRSLSMMVPFTAWLWYRTEFEIIQTLWIAIVSAGLMVFALYGLDHYRDLIMRDIEASEERALRKHGKEG
jgi:hypothetical protein